VDLAVVEGPGDEQQLAVAGVSVSPDLADVEGSRVL
jgi:hypothetical protein